MSDVIAGLKAEVERLRSIALSQDIKYMSVELEFGFDDTDIIWRVYCSTGSPQSISQSLKGPELQPVFDEVCRRITWERTINMKQIAKE